MALTAGPAINPLVTVTGLVSLLIATSMVKYGHDLAIRAGLAASATVIITAAIIISKRRRVVIAKQAQSDHGRSTSSVASALPRASEVEDGELLGG